MSSGLKIMSLPDCEFELSLKPMVVYQGFEIAMSVDPPVPEDRAEEKPKKRMAFEVFCKTHLLI